MKQASKAIANLHVTKLQLTSLIPSHAIQCLGYTFCHEAFLESRLGRKFLKARYAMVGAKVACDHNCFFSKQKTLQLCLWA